MTDKEAHKLIADRVVELLEREDVKKRMVEIFREAGREEAEKWLCRVAIATLAGL